MLLVELTVTRVFSVLFFYHYSFFAVSLVMTGLALGGLIASRWKTRSEPMKEFLGRQAALALGFSAATAVALAVVVAFPPLMREESTSTGPVVVLALVFVPGLVAAGAFLAAAFSRNEAWIGRLYAWDLVAAGLGCLACIPLMRILEGPAALLAPVLLAAAGAFLAAPKGTRVRPGAAVAAGLAAWAIVLNLGGTFPLRLPLSEEPTFEGWNDHSRVVLLMGGQHGYIKIDKTAGTLMPGVAQRAPGAPIPVERWWGMGVNHLAYRLERPLDRTAVIGVGGGLDLLAALSLGAKHVDGYEVNGIVVGLLTKHFRHVNGVAGWPEADVIHSEARVGIGHSGKRYDVIQASLIDTWAATASGGFVLSENGLYTVEGWEIFLDALTDTGVLTMTRWYLPESPAEAQRLVSLAAEALERHGIPDASAHVMLATAGPPDGTVQDVTRDLITILVSKTPFTDDEVSIVRGICRAEGLQLFAAPGEEGTEATIAALLDADRRAAAVAASPYDISPPTDMRPYFFLQLRPQDVLSLRGDESSTVLRVTFKAVRVLVLLTMIALAFTVAIVGLAGFLLPTRSAAPERRRAYRWMTLYFLGIGVGYILIQLGLHQRLILVLGQPTLALSVVLFSMLIGTGIGSAVSTRWFPDGSFRSAWAVIVVVVAAIALGLPALSTMDHIGSAAVRAVLSAAIVGVVGFVLGFAFPLGVRIVAPTGDWAVQRAWAVNGAASVAGSALAAVLGVMLGSRWVVAAGLICYLLVFLAGTMAQRASAGRS
jgi:hypothetical protein